ncbi:hypothetical protein [Metabacillus indicus]|uniref:hypothetical protein n=1 Tax=Metabacillus indicus TaxID=246786 RepID=UPI003CEBAE82
MDILCAYCQTGFQENDKIIKDDLNTLCHLACYALESDYIRDIDTYKNILEKYWFYQNLIN